MSVVELDRTRSVRRPFTYDGVDEPQHHRDTSYYSSSKVKTTGAYASAVTDPASENRQLFLLCKDSAIELRKFTRHSMVQQELMHFIVSSFAHGTPINDIAKAKYIEPHVVETLMLSLASALKNNRYGDIDSHIRATNFLELLYKQGTSSSSTKTIVTLINTIFEWISKKDYNSIELVLRDVRLSDLSPELIVGILRASGHVRDDVSSWYSLLDKACLELTNRGYNAESALKGLIKGKNLVKGASKKAI